MIDEAVGKIRTFLSSTGIEVDLIKEIAYFGPFCGKMDASQSSFTLYSGDIYQDDCSIIFDTHSVTCIRYGSEDGINYWIILNS